jgi:hypothetical protein
VVGQVATYRNGELMSDDWTPTTDGVRLMYSQGFEGAWQSFQGPTIGPKEARADFDRWLAKVVQEAFDSGSKAGVEYGVTLQKIYNF